jgi:anthranilate synthase component 2
MQVMRYHSLIAARDSLPPELLVEAVAADDAGEVHAVRHVAHPVWGVQFHPESVMTPHGKALLANFLGLAGLTAAAHA